MWRPTFATGVAPHVSGRETRAGRESAPLWTAELTFDGLSPADLATLAGFYAARRGDALPFTVPVPAELGLGATLPCRFAEDQMDAEAFAATLASVKVLMLRSVKV